MNTVKFSVLSLLLLIFLPIVIYTIEEFIFFKYFDKSFYRSIFTITLIGFFFNVANNLIQKWKCASFVDKKFRNSIFAKNNAIVYVWVLMILLIKGMSFYHLYHNNQKNVEAGKFKEDVVSTFDEKLNFNKMEAEQYLDIGYKKAINPKGNMFSVKDDEILSYEFNKHIMAYIKEIENAAAKAPQDINEQRYAEYGKKLTQFALAQEWLGFKLYLNEMVSVDADAIHAGINVAVLLGASNEFIDELISQGGELESSMLLPILQRGDIAQVKKLENYGLNVNQANLGEINMIDLALMTSSKPEVIEFLLNRNVDVTTYKENLAIDTLGIAIVNAGMNAEHVTNIISRLIQSGAEITAHHRQLMIGLQREDAIAYHELVAGFPELDPSL